MLKLFVFYIFFLCIIKSCFSIWCYRCTSATPGCGREFNWRGIGYLGDPCPEDNDICIKLTERREGQEFITRDCLSSFTSFRRDIPPDHYEGCRPAAKDVILAHYVNHSIKEHDVRRDYYPDIEYCFCFLDHRCNNANSVNVSVFLIAISALFYNSIL